MKEVSFESKTLAPLRILEILVLYSDEDHLLTHEDILRHLDHEYNIILERKSIGRHLQNLINANYDIVVTKKGCYIGSREFDNSELRVLIDNVLFSNYINETQGRHLIDKLRNMGDVEFRNKTRYVHEIIRRNRTKSPSVFYNAERIGSAIEKKKRISFYYNTIGPDGKEAHLFEEPEIVDPYYLVAMKGWYYLICADSKDRRILNRRLDRISNIIILNEDRQDLPKDDNRLSDLDKYLTSRPNMTHGRQVSAKFKIPHYYLQELTDDFGKDYFISEKTEDSFVVTFSASYWDAYDWALKNGRDVELLGPKDLRARVTKTIRALREKYGV